MEFRTFKRTRSNETRMFASVRKQVNLAKKSKIHMANLIIVLASLLVTILFIILGYIYLGMNWGADDVFGDDHGVIWGVDGDLHIAAWLYIFLIPACGLAAYAGIVAVIASNNKSPIKFLILSTVTIVYRIGFVLTQVITAPEDGGGINATLLLGQPAFFIMLLAQTYLWIRWNNEGVDGKFQSEGLHGTRAMIAWIIVGFITAFLVIFSWLLTDNTFVELTMDVIPSACYMIGAILNAFGNIFCFPFFILGNMGWFYWGFKGIFENHEPLMSLMAVSTMLQAIGLNALLVTGFCQWFKEDFIWVKGEGIKQRTVEMKLDISQSKAIDSKQNNNEEK